jgi:hypothetical protein
MDTFDSIMNNIVAPQFSHPIDAEFDWLGGMSRRFYFPNKYGASVVRHAGSYGASAGLFELAVMQYDSVESKWKLTYDTPITNDVIGWLTIEEVNGLLDQIKALAPKEEA